MISAPEHARLGAFALTISLPLPLSLPPLLVSPRLSAAQLYRPTEWEIECIGRPCLRLAHPHLVEEVSSSGQSLSGEGADTLQRSLTHTVIPYRDYEVISTLGHGSFGKVKRQSLPHTRLHPETRQREANTSPRRPTYSGQAHGNRPESRDEVHLQAENLHARDE